MDGGVMIKEEDIQRDVNRYFGWPEDSAARTEEIGSWVYVAEQAVARALTVTSTSVPSRHELISALERAIEGADDWHDDSHGGPCHDLDNERDILRRAKAAA